MPVRQQVGSNSRQAYPVRTSRGRMLVVGGGGGGKRVYAHGERERKQHVRHTAVGWGGSAAIQKHQARRSAQLEGERAHQCPVRA